MCVAALSLSVIILNGWHINLPPTLSPPSSAPPSLFPPQPRGGVECKWRRRWRRRRQSFSRQRSKFCCRHTQKIVYFFYCCWQLKFSKKFSILWRLHSTCATALTSQNFFFPAASAAGCTWAVTRSCWKGGGRARLLEEAGWGIDVSERVFIGNDTHSTVSRALPCSKMTGPVIHLSSLNLHQLL